MSEDAIRRQREYYAQTAEKYDELHLREPEHEFALAQLSGILGYYDFNSLLDVGAGTGRVLRHVGALKDSMKVTGIEPVEALRKIGHKEGVAATDLIDGDALKLPFEDDSWDIVCAFGILHHIPDPNRAIREMCRVAKHGVFFSDLNAYGCGSAAQRMVAQTLHKLRLWKPFQWLKNGGKLDKFSEGDGVYYSYSLFDSLADIKKKFPQTHISNTRGSAPGIYRGCSHLSVFAVKSDHALGDLNPNSKT